MYTLMAASAVLPIDGAAWGVNSYGPQCPAFLSLPRRATLELPFARRGLSDAPQVTALVR